MEINDLDDFFLKTGRFGRFHILNYALLFLATIATALYTSDYIFTTNLLPYRCLIPECESENETSFVPDWLSQAVPVMDNFPAKCDRFVSNDSRGICEENSFDLRVVQRCDRYVFASKHQNIIADFEIFCDENIWLLTLPGTINSIGVFFNMPLNGFLSDKYGRCIALVVNLMSSAIAGILKSLSPSYLVYVILEFAEQSFGSGVYQTVIILGSEQVHTSHRVLFSVIMGMAFAFGEVLLASLAWTFYSWRTVLQIIYVPSLLFIAYLWILPESIRWLLSKQRYQTVEEVLRKNFHISNEELKTISRLVTADETPESNSHSDKSTSELTKFVSSIKMIKNLIVCSICWITTTFVFYGISLNAVILGENTYLNFIVVSLAEIPAEILGFFYLNHWKRRYSLGVSLIFCGVASLIVATIPTEFIWWKILFFLLAKFGATFAFLVMFLYTTEMFPTTLRGLLLGITCMFGRFGSMVAPQTPLLASIWTILPSLLFSAMALVSGLLAFLLPETLNAILPQNVLQAKALKAH